MVHTYSWFTVFSLKDNGSSSRSISWKRKQIVVILLKSFSDKCSHHSWIQALGLNCVLHNNKPVSCKQEYYIFHSSYILKMCTEILASTCSYMTAALVLGVDFKSFLNSESFHKSNTNSLNKEKVQDYLYF